MTAAAGALRWDSQGDDMEEFLKALAAQLPLLLAGGIAALITAAAALATACAAFWKLSDERVKLRAEASKTEAEAAKLEAETDFNMEGRIHNLWQKVDALQTDNYEMRGQLTVKTVEIQDLNFELNRLKVRSAKRDEEFATTEQRLQECEAARPLLQTEMERLQAEIQRLQEAHAATVVVEVKQP